ncbi:MAG: zeta toxin family protein [Panacagrimonas sp.]|nr:zeta toxin family protein [Panacagrimonas sp.]MCC2659092.1 zeta toxin family protein [Panacagrimonas sp.]
MLITPEQQRIAEEAWTWAKKNRTAIARRWTDPTVFVPEEHPVSVFMAGSPGAGKTEASKELIARYEIDGLRVLRIDPDELRAEFPGYTGGNAWLFQKAVTPLVERIHDLALDQQQSFLLDGTLSSYDVARRNIDRSLKRNRTVQLLYVYQEPEQAWRFVQAREAAEGRRIEPESFLDQYFAARETVNRLKADLGRAISIDLLLKNNDGSHRLYQAGVDRIDNHIPEKYARADVRRILGLPPN